MTTSEGHILLQFCFEHFQWSLARSYETITSPNETHLLNIECVPKPVLEKTELLEGSLGHTHETAKG